MTKKKMERQRETTTLDTIFNVTKIENEKFGSQSI